LTVPVSFRDVRNDEEELAGFLRFVREDSGRGIRGGLFVVNTRGEPVSFTYSRADLPTSVLWRARDANRRTMANLAATLFDACLQSPAVLLTLAEEIPADTFAGDLVIQAPLCRVDAAASRARMKRDPDGLIAVTEGVPGLTWLGSPPGPDSVAERVVHLLLAHQLITEPFERAAIGLDAVYHEQP